MSRDLGYGLGLVVGAIVASITAAVGVTPWIAVLVFGVGLVWSLHKQKVEQ